MCCTERSIMVLVKIKTSVFHSLIRSATPQSSLDMTVATIGDKRCNELVPLYHQLQIIH